MFSLKVLEVRDLTTQIKNKKLIQNISFEMDRGTLRALVGHNGAGKSTLMKTIIGMMDKTSGEIIIEEKYDQEKSFLAFKQSIAYLPEEPLLLTELTVTQHFQLYGMTYGIAEDELQERVDQYVTGFELTDKLNAYPESLSKGMRQKVQTICALLPDVPLLLIDEPFIGLDVYAMSYFEDLIKEKLQIGTSILLTTHQLDRVKDLADDFIMLQNGEMIEQGMMTDFDTIKRGTES